MFYLLILVAVSIVCLELLAAGRNRYTFLKGRVSPIWFKLYSWRWLIGLICAGLSFVVEYPIGEYKVIGFPLPISAVDAVGKSYIGRFTVPFVVGNAVMWFFLPHIFLWFWTFFDKGKFSKEEKL